jgi:hypothetical protein
MYRMIKKRCHEKCLSNNQIAGISSKTKTRNLKNINIFLVRQYIEHFQQVELQPAQIARPTINILPTAPHVLHMLQKTAKTSKAIVAVRIWTLERHLVMKWTLEMLIQYVQSWESLVAVFNRTEPFVANPIIITVIGA